jgi:hypothetical protein
MSNPPSLMIVHVQICNNIGIFSKLKNWMANIYFSFSKLQMTLCSLETTIWINYKQKLILENKRIWKDITMYKSYAIENDF